jgi:uncharacterized SAM-binding protein YcdF (DUF218 family)
MMRFMSPLYQPLGLVWVAAVLLFLWNVRQRRWRCAWLALLFAGMLSLGGGPVSFHLLAGLERPYAGVDASKVPPADAVVMLGGVLRSSQNDVLGFDLGDSANRVVTAATLIYWRKAPVLVLGGGAANDSGVPSEGELVERWLTAWGVTKATILRLGVCKNTRDEGEHTAALFQEHGWKRVILVTSAGHMRRGEGVFRKLGIPVTCVAGDFYGMSNLEAGHQFWLFPTTGGFEALARYVHETLGWWVYRWRGWVE